MGEGRSVLIFSEEFDFQGPGVQNRPKLEIRKIWDFGFSWSDVWDLSFFCKIVGIFGGFVGPQFEVLFGYVK